MTNHWQALQAAQSGQGTPAALQQRLAGSGTPGILVGLDAQRRPFLLVELGLPAGPNLAVLQQYGNIRIVAFQNPSGSHDVTITLHDPSILDAFGFVTDYLADRLRPHSAPAARLDVVRDVLRSVEHLIQQARLVPLSPAEQVGLQAELHVLARHLIPRIGPARAVLAWTGPNWRSHDYQFDAIDIEVKSRAAEPAVTISSEFQLRERNGIGLVLAVVEFDNQPAGEMLPQAVAAARNAVAGNPTAASEFEMRLSAARYADAHAPFYTTRHREVSTDWYRVDSAFPQAVPNSTGVSQVKFDVDLRSATSHRTSARVLDVLGTFP